MRIIRIRIRIRYNDTHNGQTTDSDRREPTQLKNERNPIKTESKNGTLQQEQNTSKAV